MKQQATTRYIATIPFIPSMGTTSPINVSDNYGETKEECLLWHLNSMRRHDGLPEWKRIPSVISKGIVYKPIFD